MNYKIIKDDRIIGNYFDIIAINNTSINEYEDNFRGFVNYYKNGIPIKSKGGDSIRLGSLVDFLLNDLEPIESKFHIFDDIAPTAQSLIFIEELVKTGNCDFEIAYEALKIKNGGKLQKKIDHFRDVVFEENKNYYNVLLDQSKKVITTEVLNFAKSKVLELRNNSHTSFLVNAETNSNMEVYVQLEIYAEVEGLLLKGALDKVIVDHKNRKVIMIDNKTCFNPLYFSNDVKKYKYYRQASYYTKLVKIWMEDKGIQDYQLMDFLFVVISTSCNSHYVAKLSSVYSTLGETGGTDRYGNVLKGWSNILEEIIYLDKINNWSYPYEIIKNNGVITLNI